PRRDPQGRGGPAAGRVLQGGRRPGRLGISSAPTAGPPSHSLGSDPPRAATPRGDPMNDTNLKAALAYARQGWAVFPLKPGQKKPPLTTHGYKDATTDPEAIRAWWGKWPAANIGLACGASGVVV